MRLLAHHRLLLKRPGRFGLLFLSALAVALFWLAYWANASAQETLQSSQQTSLEETGSAAIGVDTPIEDPEAPLYSPFTARYLLDEVKQLRIDVERTRAEMIERQVQREYAVAKDAAAYARNAVELFFFIITAMTTLLVFLGWSSIRDVRRRVQEVAEAKVGTLVEGYSERLDKIESELAQKSKRLKEAQDEIDRTNEIHSLWLRASQESAPASKIGIYDEILQLRPDDTEAMTFKADAALELDETQWALSLSNRALSIDPRNGHALYQRACAYAVSGAVEEALDDLKSAIEISEGYRDDARHDSAFGSIRDSASFRRLVEVGETSS